MDGWMDGFYAVRLGDTQVAGDALVAFTITIHGTVYKRNQGGGPKRVRLIRMSGCLRKPPKTLSWHFGGSGRLAVISACIPL